MNVLFIVLLISILIGAVIGVRALLIRYFNVGKLYKHSPKVDSFLMSLIPYIKSGKFTISKYRIDIELPDGRVVGVWNENKWYGWLMEASLYGPGIPSEQQICKCVYSEISPSPKIYRLYRKLLGPALKQFKREQKLSKKVSVSPITQEILSLTNTNN